jgi:Tfp pilus assembly protein PilX
MNILKTEHYKQDNMMSLFILGLCDCRHDMAKSVSSRKYKGVKNQEGFVLITSMMVLVALTFLGIAALNTASFETMIAGNEKEYQRQFFYSDGAINAMLGEDNRPNVGNLPGGAVNLNTISCTDLQGHAPFVNYDVDGDAATAPTDLYYLQRLSATPFEVEVLSCSSLGNAVAGISAGVRFGQGPVNPGNPTSY